MITPYGNPQNLYLYSFYNIDTLEFFRILVIQSLIVAILLAICCSFVKSEPLKIKENNNINLDKGKLFMYVVLFLMVILTIFRVIPNVLTLITVTIAIITTDIKRLKEVDYSLLTIFCAFFVFSGNIARIPAVKMFISDFVVKNTLLAGIMSCQFISNVPTAIFLSKFTDNYRELLISVNVGSLGILISSLASLITLKEFLKHQPKNLLKYLGMFTLFNTSFLIILIFVTYVF